MESNFNLLMDKTSCKYCCVNEWRHDNRAEALNFSFWRWDPLEIWLINGSLQIMEGVWMHMMRKIVNYNPAPEIHH